MTLDTNILIAYLNGEAKVVETLSEWQGEGRLLLISTITIAEVLAFPALTPLDMDRTRRFLQHFISVPFDKEVAETAALLARAHRLRIPDAAIAATAFLRRVPLVTRDRQFRHIGGLAVLEI